MHACLAEAPAAVAPAGSCRKILGDPDKHNLGMPGLLEATVNTTRPFLASFLHLCHVMRRRFTRSSVNCNTTMETRAQGILMCLQRMTLDSMKGISQ